MFERILAAGPLWIAMAPALFLHWLPWWYVAPIWLGATISEAWAEDIGKRAPTPHSGEGEKT